MVIQITREVKPHTLLHLKALIGGYETSSGDSFLTFLSASFICVFCRYFAGIV